MNINTINTACAMAMYDSPNAVDDCITGECSFAMMWLIGIACKYLIRYYPGSTVGETKDAVRPVLERMIAEMKEFDEKIGGRFGD